MDDLLHEQPETEEEHGYRPRPAWQVWGARIALVIFILALIYYYRTIAGGGL